MGFRRTLVGVCLMALALAGTVFAQSFGGTVSGVVKDPAGAVIPNVSVIARNVGTGTETKTTTGPDGFYRFSSLVSGEYSLEVESPGFKKITTAPFRVSVGDTLRQDLTLELGAVTETVNVEEKTTAVNTEDAQLGKVVRDPQGLPVLSGAQGRNVLSLATLQPGVVPAGQVGPFAVNGMRAQSNNYLLDGGDTNDLAINTPDAVTVISPNALSEFRIITGAMKAEFGRNAGAVVAVQTRSGTNNFHGGATEVFRNTKLNAVPFFQKVTPGGTPEAFANGLPRKPQWNTNDFDAQFGGPIRRDKAFFFLSYQGFRRRQGESNSATVLNDAQRAALQASGTSEAKAVLAMVPPASAGNTLFTSPTNRQQRDGGLAKLDYSFTDRNRLAFTFFIDDREQFSPFAFSGSLIPGFGTTDTRRFLNLVLNDTHTFSPTLLNEFRASYHRLGYPSVVPVNTTTPASLGLAGIVPDDAAAAGPPWVDMVGFSGFGNTIQGPQSRWDNTIQWVDNVSWMRGRHYLKFGGEFRTYAQNQVFDFINNGYIYVDGSGTLEGVVPRRIPAGLDPTGVLNDFANGFATEFDQASANRQGYRTRSFNLFIQDDWKAKPNFTLNFGLRWEYNNGLKEVHDNVVAFRKGQKSTVFTDAPTGMVYVDDAGIARSTYSEDLNNFGPRFGFSWDVFKNGKLSVRGGYGMFYDIAITELTLQQLGQPPFGIEPFALYVDYKNPWPTARETTPIPQPFPFTPVARGGHFNFVDISPIALTTMDPGFVTPYSQQWNLQVQYEPFRNWLFDVGYVGTAGTKMLNRRDLNPAIAGPGATTGNTDRRRILNQGHPEAALYGGTPFSGITDQTSDANSFYNSLQVSVTKRFAHGFQMMHAYTYGHAIDNASGLRVTSNPFDRSRDRGNSEFDIRHRYVVSYTYEFPWMKLQQGPLGRVLGGWGLSGITTFQTGVPINITEPTDRALSGAGANRPDYIGGTVQFFDPRSTSAVTGRANSWFDGTGGGTSTAATNPYFRRVGSGTSWAAGAGRYGTFGRNVLHGPGINNWDFTLFKRTKISEAHSIEFRAEFFNLFNHAQFNNPTTSIGSSLFGRITGTRDPRLIQFVLRYVF